MKNLVKSTMYAGIGVSLLALNYTTKAIDVTSGSATTKADNATDGGFVQTLDNMFGFLIGLLYFIAVVFAVYGGFQILTASGDEDKVKSGKTTLINAVIGLIVIFLASQIISWIISIMTTGGQAIG